VFCSRSCLDKTKADRKKLRPERQVQLAWGIAEREILGRPREPGMKLLFLDGDYFNLVPANLVIQYSHQVVFKCRGCGAVSVRNLSKVPKTAMCITCFRHKRSEEAKSWGRTVQVRLREMIEDEAGVVRPWTDEEIMTIREVFGRPPDVSKEVGEVMENLLRSSAKRMKDLAIAIVEGKEVPCLEGELLNVCNEVMYYIRKVKEKRDATTEMEKTVRRSHEDGQERSGKSIRTGQGSLAGL